MTRYSNPLPHSQVPNPQGRPAGTAQAGQAPHYEPPGWPAPNGGAQRTGRPAAPAYGDPAGYGEPQSNGRPAHHDPYAALRPDGYGYGQQQPAADPYGLAGYTAPQPQPQAPQPAYGQPSQTLSTPQQQQPAFGPAASPSSYGGGYGASSPATPPYGGSPGYGFGSPQAPEPSFGGDYGYASSGPGQWGADHYAEPQLEPGLGPLGGYQNGPHSQHGSFDQSYAEDDAQYEDEPRRRGGEWKKVVGLVACTILVGGGLAIAYSSLMGGGDGKDAPLIKGASGPSKVKPSEPGGKQFAHADSKIMGRLGEGDSGGDEGREASGVRKVPVVTVGRDGSIQPPSAEEQTSAVVAVPGLTVIDGFGGGPSPTRAAGPQAGSPPVQMVASAEADPVAVAPPKRPAQPVVEETGAVQQTKATVIPKADPPPKKQKVAAVAPAEAGPKPTGAGYVAVLASVPASGSSRIDALKQFADMQQKYTAILHNKTPDVQEANLGEKGTYHRLLVGPPGSRDSASSLCTQLKAQGYNGCWVTAY